MPYISNPYAGKARRMAVNDVWYRGLSQTQAARKYGVTRSAICKWLQRASLNYRTFIDTIPSRPHSHPNQLKPEIVKRIVKLRKRLKRCAPIIHAHLQQEGMQVSLSSVERTLRRQKLTRKKKNAKDYIPIPRPDALYPGSLVQVDTIHFVKDAKRTFIYAVIDVYSRRGYAEYHPRISHQTSFNVILHAQRHFRFPIRTVQTDNGPEFSPSLSYLLKRKKIVLRHSRVRTPNDNAYVERFIRTIQEECFRGRIPDERTVERQLYRYLVFYNTKRLHLSLQCQTPSRFVSKVLT
jgi:transposase InsO family protein